MTIRLPRSAVGLRLARIDRKENLVLCEAMRFESGRAGVEATLRRAWISGRVELGGVIANHFAEVLDDSGDIVATVALDRGSYSALKNRWMRCKVEGTMTVLDTEAPPAASPAEENGWEWAMVEIFGHRSHAGRVREEERFGAKLLRIDVPIKGDPAANGWETHWYGGSSIFSFTLTDEDSVMRANKPYESPARYRLPAPDDEPGDDDPAGADDPDLEDA